MKKIVALVLAMVMVLGLATTAFAAKGGDNYTNASNNYNWDFVVTPEDSENDKDGEFATYTIEAVALKNMKGTQKFFDATLTDVEKGDKEEVEVDTQDEFVKVTTTVVADVVIVDGKTISYYAKADRFEDGYIAKAVKVTLPVLPIDDADRKCNTLYAKGPAATTFYFAEGVLWVGVGTTTTPAELAAAQVLNLGGDVLYAFPVENIKSDAYWTYWEHDFQLEKGYINHNNVEDYDGSDEDWGVTKVYCDNCKAEFKFVETPYAEVAVAVFGEDNYEQVGPVFIEKVSPAIPGVTGATSAPAVDGDKVESPKTFDAGIAMYVGMSVMAAAGSAVVLKKKD